MPHIQYAAKHFTAETQQTIDIANRIIAEYTAQGFDMTLRQLYYQCVARGYIENTERSYKLLAQSPVSQARLVHYLECRRSDSS
jgi:hypothetical protein